METASYLKRLFDYDAWANRETLASLKAAGAKLQHHTLKYMAHIIAAEELWLNRLNEGEKHVVVWPEDLTIEACEAAASALSLAWQNYLASLAPIDYSRKITYTNSKGEGWSNTVEDILTHVVMHSVYHRAQIAAELRASGQTPAYTDFIECVRRGYIQ